MDTTIKLVVVILTLSTVAAVISALFGSRFAEHAITQSFDLSNKNHLYFLIAFIGWMPTPIDVSLWSSLWSQAKNKEMSEKQTLQEALIDFRIGYAGSMLVAVAFLTLGALILHGSGEALAESGSGFASQLISMYTQSIGAWAYYLIAIAALTTMFSTTLTVTDAYPRVLLTIAGLFLPHLSSAIKRLAYLAFILLVAGGALFLISIAGPRMTFMVDIATSLSFISAPILAYINLCIMKSKRVPKSLQPGILLSIWSWLGIVFLGFFTVAYIWWLMYN